MTILSKGCKTYYQKDVNHRELESLESFMIQCYGLHNIES